MARRLRVARPGQRACDIARLDAQLLVVRREIRLEHAQQRAPAFHGAAEFVHRHGVGIGGILDGGARLAQDVVGNGAQRLAHRQSRLQGRLVVHAKVL